MLNTELDSFSTVKQATLVIYIICQHPRNYPSDIKNYSLYAICRCNDERNKGNFNTNKTKLFHADGLPA